MKKLLGQLILTGILLVGLTLLVLPAGKVHAAVTSNRPGRSLATLSGTTWQGTNAIFCGGFIQYAYTGTDGHLNIAFDYRGSNSVQTYTDTSQATPSIACWQNTVWIAWQANDNSHAIYVADATDATCPPGVCPVGTSFVLAHRTTLPNSQATLGSPHLGVNGSTMFIAYKWTSNSSNMTVNETTNGTTWIKQTTIAGNSAASEPSLTSYGGNLIIAWAGTDIPAHINFATYSDGNPNLSNKVVASDTTVGAENTSIGISTYNNRIQFAFQASDGSAVIYTGSWSSITGYVHNGHLGGSYTANDVGLVGLNVYYSDPSTGPYTLRELQMPG